MTDQSNDKVAAEFERVAAALDLDKDLKEVAEEVLGQLLNSQAFQVLSAQTGEPSRKGRNSRCGHPPGPQDPPAADNRSGTRRQQTGDQHHSPHPYCQP